jgi:hypothetical protein
LFGRFVIRDFDGSAGSTDSRPTAGPIDACQYKWFRQKLSNAELPNAVRLAQIDHPNPGFGGVFSQKLAAGAARHRAVFGFGNDGNGPENGFAGGEGLKQSHALGTASQAITGAFDIGAGDNFASGRQQGGADPKAGIRGYGALARLERRSYKDALFICLAHKD